MKARALAALTLCIPFAVTACGAPADEGAGSTAATSAATCTPEGMNTHTAGTLTIATDDPAYEPWFADNDPSTGKGYEAAVAYAIATRLGYEKDKVSWVRVPFNSVVNPGDHPFDFDLNQVSITPERRKAVDFSTGYYDVTQTVITTAGSSIAKATSVEALVGARLGAQVGTTSYTAVADQIKPKAAASVYDTNDAAVQALKSGQIDGIVVDLPTAFYMTATQLDNGVIIGQLPTSGQAEQFGAVLPKDSALTSCISQAVDGLKADGTLASLQKQWLADQGAPELTVGTPAASSTASVGDSASN